MKLRSLWVSASLALCFSASAQAYNCSGTSQYVDGSAYSNGAVVKNNNAAYQCSVSGWCSIGGPYAPGEGWAWTNAWNDLGGCDGSGSSSSVSSSSSSVSSSVSSISSSSSSVGGGNCPVWSSNAIYYAGDVVLYQGSYYLAEHDNPGYDPTISTWFWEPTPSCPGGNGSSSSSSVGGGNGFSSIVSEAQFNQMFPNRNGFYTYAGLVNAAATFPAFATTGNLTTQKREAAAALANFSHETGGLYYIEEIAKGEYCSGGATACGVCAPGKRYYGRGPIQLSWNYNYCTAGQALGLDLWSNPDQVAQNATTAWRTALWFWMTQSGAGYRPAHQSMVNDQGFGETIRTINGSLECNGGHPAQVQSRINLYQDFTQILGVTPGSNLGC